MKTIRRKRILSAILAISMIMSLIGQSALAADWPTANGITNLKSGYTDVPTLRAIRVVPDSTITSGPKFRQATNAEKTTPAVGDKIYIGLVMDKIDQFKAYSDEAYGIYSINMDMIFDHTYLMPEPDAMTPLNSMSDEQKATFKSTQWKTWWNGDKAKNALFNRINVDGSYVKDDVSDWTDEYAGFASDTGIFFQRSDAMQGINNPAVEGLAMAYNSMSGNPSKKGTGNSFIYMVYQFEVIAIPPKGTKVLDVAQNINNTTIAFGETGQGESYSWNNGGDVDDLATFFKIESDDLNLFPDTYKVTYNANGSNYSGAAFDSTRVTAGVDDFENVNQNSYPTLQQPTTPPANFEDLLEIPDGYYFDKWSAEANPAATTEPFDTSTQVTSSMVNASKEMTVYAHYAAGHRADFDLNGDGATRSVIPGATATPMPAVSSNKSVGKDSGTALFTADETFDNTVGTVERANYTGKGWYTKNSAGSFETKINEGVLRGTDTTTLTGFNATTDSIKVYQKWESTDDTGRDYTITFDTNDATLPSGVTVSATPDPSSQKFASAETMKSIIGGLPQEPKASNTDYKFLGWYKNKSGDGEKLTEDTVLGTYSGNKNITVYAKWGYVDDPLTTPTPKPNDTTVRVHFVQDNESNTVLVDAKYKEGTYKNGIVNDKYVNYGQTILDLPAKSDFEKTGSAFGGWATAPQPTPGATPPAGAKYVDATTTIDENLNISSGGGSTSIAAATGGLLTLFPYWKSEVTVKYDLNGMPAAAVTNAVDYETKTGIPGETLELAELKADDLTAAKVDFKGWATKANGSEPDPLYANDQTTVFPDEDTTLYAIWDSTDDDAITITFDGNVHADSPYQPVLTPHTSGNEKTYSIKRAPSQTVTQAQMPSGIRQDSTGTKKYTLKYWDKSKTALPSGAPGSDYTVPATDAADVTLYAVWGDPVDPKSVTFNLNAKSGDTTAKFSDEATVGTTTKTIVFAAGDIIGNQMLSGTSDDYGFDGWMLNSSSETEYSASHADAVKSDYVVNSDITVKGYWSENVTITFDMNSGVLPSPALPTATIAPITMKKGQSISDVVSGAAIGDYDVEREYYTFEGWHFDDDWSSATTTDATLAVNTPIQKSITVHAQFRAKVDLVFNDATIKFPYDGTAKTPVTDGNYKVWLLDQSQMPGDPDDYRVTDLTSDFSASKLAVEYRPNVTPTPTAMPSTPVNAGTYKMDISLDTSVSGYNKYTIYEFNSYPDIYEIEPADVDYIVSENYQYYTDLTGDPIQDIKIEFATPAPSPAPDITATNMFDPTVSPRPQDIKITFHKLLDDGSTDSSASDIVNDMPTDFGTYSITIEPADDSNFGVGDVKDKLTGDTNPKLYIVPLSRTIEVDYGDGFVKGSTTNHKADYVTVTFSTPSPINAVANVKTTIAVQASPKPNDMPNADDHYDAPANKVIDKWVINKGTADEAEFTKTTDILPGDGSKLTVYAVWKDANWKVTFHDTNAGTTDKPKMDDTVYTIPGGQSISGGVQAIDGTPVPTSSPVTTLPEPSNAPENKMFAGWVRSQADATAALSQTKAQFDAAMAVVSPAPKKLFLASDVETADLDVYAAYVLSNDDKLGGANFYEGTDNTGTPVTFTDSTFSGATPAPTFDPDTTDYYIVVDNTVENIFGEFIPSQPGSTVTVTKTEPSPAPTVTATWNATKKQWEFTTPIDQTVYDSTSSTNTDNVFVVKVTPPAGGTPKEYTFTVRRRQAGEIKLKYGNSPFAEIMKDADHDDDWKKTAKEKFTHLNTSSVPDGDDRYATGYMPTIISQKNADGSMQFGVGALKSVIRYNTKAWADNTDNGGNLDRDETAIFVYNDSVFRDPGFTATDANGKPVDDTKITRTIKVKRMLGANKLNTLNQVTDPEASDAVTTNSLKVYTNQPNDMLYTDLTVSGNDPRPILPGVYKIHYEFTDEVTGNKVEQDRYMAVFYKTGDANWDKAPNQPDLNYVKSVMNNGGVVSLTNGGAMQNSFQAFKMADTNNDGAITQLDLNNIKSRMNTGTDYPFYYRELPKE